MLLTKTIFVLLLMMHGKIETSAEEEGDDCAAGWTFNPESSFCYYFSEQYASFNVADRNCRRMSSTVASIVSADEYYSLLPLLYVQRQKCNYVDDCLNHWIGLRNVAGSPSLPQKWTWIDGSPYSDLNTMWGPSQPSGKYFCGSLHTVDQGSELIGFWRDANCNKPMRYICKKMPTSV